MMALAQMMAKISQLSRNSELLLKSFCWDLLKVFCSLGGTKDLSLDAFSKVLQLVLHIVACSDELDCQVESMKEILRFANKEQYACIVSFFENSCSSRPFFIVKIAAAILENRGMIALT